MPKFYLATKRTRAAQAEKLLEALNSRGWERTFTWNGKDKAGNDEYPELALAELAGVREADVLIALLPGGYGTHVEIGAALALGKPVILHAPDQKTLDTPYPCVFHYHPGVKLIVSEVVDANAIVALAFQQECLIPGPVELLGKTYVSER
jgi:nucleoside 2-deoxyribosyltransferase